MTDANTIETLWITDAEMIRRLGVPEKVMRRAIKALDENRRSGFPRKVGLYGDRRYWPAVKEYMDRTNGLKLADPERRSA